MIQNLPLHPLIPPETIVVPRPSLLEYRLSTSGGIRVVQIFLNRSEPAFAAFAEDRPSGPTSPIVLTISELNAYVQDAARRISL